MSLLLVTWSFYDLRKVFKYRNVLKMMVENDKINYVESLGTLEAILNQIINALGNQSIAIFNSHLPVLVTTSTGLISKIRISYDKITNDIKELSDRESKRRIGGGVSALLSVGSFVVTYWNWNNWNAPQRASGLIFGGGTAVSAGVSLLTANQLHEMQKTLKQLLTELDTLNMLIEPISHTASTSYEENIEYTHLRDQFASYKRSIETFKATFE
ncbi:hypothetical protein RhiirA4_390968 [Rhizophagus irregularis]|uniref:Uncharacterized protein n=1 Tax=Rhizophagus irregularis TaxID=588596 RepID=A0A2I1FTS0_9GLOM|nr:hypothetical protein RhiirA4_390968 [Rhizophagus irregularis]